jgi:hypothetical protein
VEYFIVIIGERTQKDENERADRENMREVSKGCITQQICNIIWYASKRIIICPLYLILGIR